MVLICYHGYDANMHIAVKCG